MDDLTKQVVSLRYWLTGKEYYDALRAMEFAMRYHTGTRKDGATPEFSHQIAINHFIRTISTYLMYPQNTISAVFLHDIHEDYDVPIETLRELFGNGVANPSWLMAKKNKGMKKQLEYYYDEIADCPIASIGKGSDRIHNIQSMHSVFTLKGQKWYIEETETLILPMLKKARRKFPQQEMAYENIKHMLLNQIELIKAIHEAKNQ